jgi:hypothetical protein
MDHKSVVPKPCVDNPEKTPSGTPAMLPPLTSGTGDGLPSNLSPLPGEREEDHQLIASVGVADNAADETPRVFSLIPTGDVGVTASAQEILSAEDILAALKRHCMADWGDVSADDRRRNDLALKNDDTLRSAYSSATGSIFWVITEWDRSSTCVLLPNDY